jgi:tubulin polyglutamylase TTLL4
VQQARLTPALELQTLPGSWSIDLVSTGVPKKKEPKRRISLLKSVFSGRPPVIFFDYEPSCGSQSRDVRRLLNEDELLSQGFANLPKMFYSMEETADSHEYKAVVNTLQHGGLYSTSSATGKWCLYWSDHPKPDFVRRFNPFQKANHFPGSWHIGRKDLLWRNAYRMKRKWPKDFNIVPTTFVMPEDFQSWVAAREQSSSALWICKPVNDACGRGIRLIGSTVSVEDERKFQQKAGVIQKYLEKPFLINGFKFDLRVYVVVTSFDPLKIYLNPEGLVRLATEPYAPSRNTLDHRTMHLTNYSVNKLSDAYVHNNDSGKHAAVASSSVGYPAGQGEEQDDELAAANEEQLDKDENDDPNAPNPEAQSSKWSFQQLREYLANIGQDYDSMMDRVKDVIIKALIAVETPVVNACQLGANYTTIGAAQQAGPNATNFEIYGFDVMLDEKLKPWLLEVNVFPSLASSSPLDKRIKTQLAADALTLVGFQPFDHDLVDRAQKEENMRRLQGLAPKSGSVSRSHTVQSLESLKSLKELGEGEWRLILDTHDEYMRRGMLERIYPTAESRARYAEFFAAPRYANRILELWLEAGGECCFLPEHRAALIPAWIPEQICFDTC